jgi:CMP-2-keto-3-deoxyoctulosonic acid synthetase
VTDNEGKALYFSRSKIPSGGGTGTTYKNIGVYGFEKNLLTKCTDMDSDLETAERLEQLRLLEHGYEIQTVNVDYDSLSVDRENDIPLVEDKIREEDVHGI